MHSLLTTSIRIQKGVGFNKRAGLNKRVGLHVLIKVQGADFNKRAGRIVTFTINKRAGSNKAVQGCIKV